MAASGLTRWKMASLVSSVCTWRLTLRREAAIQHAVQWRAHNDAVAAMRVGAGTEAGVAIGPLIDGRAVDKSEAHVTDALEKGAARKEASEAMDK